MAGPVALYLHIPFCPKKCLYCDFLSFAGRGNLLPAYLAALRKEICLLEKDELQAGTVYIGGGTPTIAAGKDLALLVQEIKRTVRLQPAAEITVEANPGTVSEQKLALLRETGINRLSFGAQAGQDRMLQALGRIHTVSQTEEAVVAARRAGFTNINLDLLYGLPGQTVADWEKTLKWAVGLRPDHLSCYCLQVETGTLLGEKIGSGHLTLPAEEEMVIMFNQTLNILADAGYLQYEISNFAPKGYECSHNLCYWQYRDYFGLGLGSHSFVSGERRVNEKSFPLYINKIMDGKQPVRHKETISPLRGMTEMIMLGLRLNRGIDAGDFSRRWKRDLRSFLSPQAGMLEENNLIYWKKNSCRLTTRGMLVSNKVLAELLDPYL